MEPTGKESITESITPLYPNDTLAPNLFLEDIKLENTPPNENSSLKDENNDDCNIEYDNMDLINDIKKNLGLKIHLCVGVIIIFIVMIVWQTDKHASHWYFVHPMAVVALSLSIHYYILKKTPFNILFSLLLIVNLDCILTWSSYRLKGLPYPIFVLFPTAMIYYLIKYFKKPKEERNLFRFFVGELIILSAFFYMIWAFYGNPRFPWFIIPIIVLSIPLVIYYLRFIKGNKDILILLITVTSILTFLVFTIWFFTKSVIPIWFLIPMTVLIVILSVLHYRKSNSEEKAETDTFETV